MTSTHPQSSPQELTALPRPRNLPLLLPLPLLLKSPTHHLINTNALVQEVQLGKGQSPNRQLDAGQSPSPLSLRGQSPNPQVVERDLALDHREKGEYNTGIVYSYNYHTHHAPQVPESKTPSFQVPPRSSSPFPLPLQFSPSLEEEQASKPQPQSSQEQVLQQEKQTLTLRSL